MKNSKLKRKLWLTTTLVFLTYTSILLLNPSIWLSLLTIIIPTGVLTVGIPVYSILRYKKEKLENRTEQVFNTNNIKTNEITEKNIIKKEKTQLPNIEPNIINETYYKTTEIKEKNKVKTKGTMH